jgi:hypothetical protein
LKYLIITTPTRIADNACPKNVYPIAKPTTPPPIKTRILAIVIFETEEMIIILGRTFVLSEDTTIEFSNMKVEDDAKIETETAINVKLI